MKVVTLHPIQRHSLKFERYESPRTLDEAMSLLTQHQDKARLIAGGTDLLLEMERGDRPPVDTLIDVTRIPGIDYVKSDGDMVRFGPAVTHGQAVSSDMMVEDGLPLAQACWEVGSPQLRNRATIAGNLVTASPANDTISALMALGCEVTLTSARGARTLDLARFYRGVRETVLAPDEMVTDLAFRRLSATRRGIFVKLGLRRAQAISVVHLSCVLDIRDGVVQDARIAIGSVAPVVMMAEKAAAALVGKELTTATIENSARIAVTECRPIDDIRSTADYRLATVRVMLRRALEALRDGRERERWPRYPITLSTGPADEGSTDHSPRHSDGSPLRATVNGRQVETRGEVSRTLLDWLREDVGQSLQVDLTGTKEGCAEGECGACTVFMGGSAVMSCLVPAPRADGTTITTIEALAEPDGSLHPLQRAFIDRGAVQCGFCTPGLVMAGAKLVDERSVPALDEIRAGLSGNLCRCTGYYKIIGAVELAAADREGIS